MLYNSVAINISNPQSQLNHTAHFDDLKQKNWWFEIGDLVGDFTKKLVTRMDGAPNYRWLWLKTAHIPTLDQRRRHGCIFFTLPCHLVRDVVPCFLVHSHPSCLCYRCHACLVLSMQSINLLVFCFPIWPPEGSLGYMSCDNLLMCSKSSIPFLVICQWQYS